MSSHAHTDVLRLPSHERHAPTCLPLRLALVVALLILLAVLAPVAPVPVVAPIVLVILDLASLNLLGRGFRILLRGGRLSEGGR